MPQHFLKEDIMVIQSKRVWIAGQFIPAQVEVEEGKISNIYPYGTKAADEDFGEKRIVPGFIDVHLSLIHISEPTRH